jgi:hypothetical protein
MSTAVTKSLPFLLVAILMLGCTANSPYRTEFSRCSSQPDLIEQQCGESSLQTVLNPQKSTGVDYLMGFVEFDDQGQFHDRRQVNFLIDQLVEESTTNNLIMVVFVHGWKHNAEIGDQNIENFRHILTQLSDLEEGSFVGDPQMSKPRKVVGIYVGWRGKSLDAGFLTNLSFWERKNTAHKVGHGGVTELLGRLEGIRQVDQRLDEGESTRQTKLVTIGHSFGGAVVFSALGQILTERFLDIEGMARSPNGYGDLVVLINPAFEAMRYANLQNMAAERPTYFQGQRPILAIITSEADQANKIAFPAGRFFSTLFEKEKSDAQEKENRTAVGHYAPFRTHYLKWVEETTEQPLMAAPGAGAKMLSSLGKFWDQSIEELTFPGSVLSHTGGQSLLNPYLVIYADKRIIPDHNDIYDPRLRDFLRYFMLLSTEKTAP